MTMRARISASVALTLYLNSTMLRLLREVQEYTERVRPIQVPALIGQLHFRHCRSFLAVHFIGRDLTCEWWGRCKIRPESYAYSCQGSPSLLHQDPLRDRLSPAWRQHMAGYRFHYVSIVIMHLHVLRPDLSLVDRLDPFFHIGSASATCRRPTIGESILGAFPTCKSLR